MYASGGDAQPPPVIRSSRMLMMLTTSGIPRWKSQSRESTLRFYPMDIQKLLIALRQEHERLSAAIIAIERLTQAQADSGSLIKKRGRPPGSKNKPKVNPPQN